MTEYKYNFVRTKSKRMLSTELREIIQEIKPVVLSDSELELIDNCGAEEFVGEDMNYIGSEVLGYLEGHLEEVKKNEDGDFDGEQGLINDLLTLVSKLEPLKDYNYLEQSEGKNYENTSD